MTAEEEKNVREVLKSLAWIARMLSDLLFQILDVPDETKKELEEQFDRMESILNPKPKPVRKTAKKRAKKT